MQLSQWPIQPIVETKLGITLFFFSFLSVGNVLYVGNVGDSRSVLCRDSRAIPLTRDHRPDNQDEKEKPPHCCDVDLMTSSASVNASRDGSGIFSAKRFNADNVFRWLATLGL